MMKKLLCLMFACLLSLSMFACSKPSDGGSSDNGGGTTSAGGKNEVVIEFFGWGDAAEINNYQTLVNQFMAENENITVVYNGESSTTYMTSLRNRVNNLPDIFYMPDTDFLEWAASGTLLDITNYVTDEDLNKLWPDAVNEYYFDQDAMTLGKSQDARLYGLPKDLGPFTLVYNKDLLDTLIAQNNVDKDWVYGLLDPEDPMTWQELVQLLTAIDTDPNDNIFGISHYELQAAIYSNNANFFNNDASQEQISQKNFYDAVQWIVDLTTVHHVMPTAAQQTSNNGYIRFKSGSCVFSFMGPWDCAEFWKTVEFNYDIVPVAYNGENPDAKSTAWIGSMGYCLNGKLNPKKSADKAKIEAAIKLANWLCANENAQRKFYELGQQVPNIQSMTFDEYLAADNQILASKNPPSRKVWVDTIYNYGANDKIHGKIRAPYYTYNSDWLTDLTDWFDANGMWDGRKTAKEVCESYAATFQETLDEMKGKM